MTATRTYEFAVTIPHGTPASAPVTVATPFPVAVVDEIHWRVPRGSNGLMGWRITSAKAQIIPAALGTWIIASGQSGVWRMEGAPDSGAWEVTGYNTGTFDHQVFVTYLVHSYQRPPGPIPLHPGSVLAPVPDLSHAGPPIGGRP